MRLVKDRVVEHPHRYKLTKVAGTEDVYDLEQVPGTVTDAGTAVNRQLFNSIDSALLCTHSKTGTVHTFTLNSNVAAFVPGQTIYTVKAALTASIEYGDTFTLTDGTTSYTGIVPKTSEGGNYRVTLFQELSPVVIFEVNLGGSAKHAFFRGGSGKRLYREAFATSGEWICPDFVDEVYVQAFGGGGGGGGGANRIDIGSLYNCSGGGGGGGGHMATGAVRVTPGTKYTFTIGAGGNGGAAAGSSASATNGSDGGATTFISVSAAGGSGGGACSASGLCAGGSGGAGGGHGGAQGGSPGSVGASTQFAEASGRQGGDGYGIMSDGGAGNTKSGSAYGYGGGGGASYGPGGDGAMRQSAAGSNGKFGGGGGGGSNGDGGKGGSGILFISYYADPSMLSDVVPEEFDIRVNGDGAYPVAMPVMASNEIPLVDDPVDESTPPVDNPVDPSENNE